MGTTRRFSILAAACATLAAGAGAAQVHVASAGPAARSVAAPPLRLGSHGVEVRVLQRQLVALGYLPGKAVDGLYGMRTWHAVVAFQSWEGLTRSGVAGRGTRAALEQASRPRPWAKVRRALLLDLRRQVLLVVRNRRTARVVHVSSAAPGYWTPRGRYRVYRREWMSWSVRYRAWMPYALYFSGGYAIHGFDPVPAYPASHGCVRIPLDQAPFVYAVTPIGTPVLIR